MLHSLFNRRPKNDEQSAIDNSKSPAFLLFLSEFTSQKPITYYTSSTADKWHQALGESPADAVNKLVNDGLLELASLPELLDYALKVPDLKQMLKAQGQPTTGTKPKLIEALIAVNPQAAQDLVKGVALYKCTDKGIKLVDQFTAQQRQERAVAEQGVMEAIVAGRFRQAAQIVAAFEGKQLFPRGLGKLETLRSVQGCRQARNYICL